MSGHAAARQALRIVSRDCQQRLMRHRAEIEGLVSLSRERVALSRRRLGTPPGAPPLRPERRRLDFLAALIGHCSDPILITGDVTGDPAGPHILFCNPAFIRMTGYAEHELRGHNPRLFLGLGADPGRLDRLCRRLRARQSAAFELLTYGKSGVPFRVAFSVVPVATGTGCWMHWIAHRPVLAGYGAQEPNPAAFADPAGGVAPTEARLAHIAFHDDLTQLHNRAFFVEQLSVLLARDPPNGEPRHALLFIDLDRFKSVNDMLGHAAGDRLLVEIARRLAGCAGPSDILARIGGDEFALLASTGGAADAAMPIAERVRLAVARPFRLGEQTVASGCSIGVAPLTAAYRNAESLMHDADIAMYEAKRSGGLRPVLFTGSVGDASRARLALQSELLPGLARGEFELLFQPIFSTGPVGPVSVEALVRWHHPRRGLIEPDGFLPMAEECGLSRPIGRWVLRETLRQARNWIAGHPDPGMRLNVNVSPRELLDENFADDAIALLEEAGLPGRRLALEINESVFQDGPPQVLRTLHRLREAGISLALDRFGTGYSRLGSIESYPIDTIKIDRSLVSGLLGNPRIRATVQAIISLARAFDLDVVAAGIETEAQHRALIEMGCRHFQGFLLCPPLGIADAMTLPPRAIPDPAASF